MKIQRYELYRYQQDSEMEPQDNGEWVKYEDYANSHNKLVFYTSHKPGCAKWGWDGIESSAAQTIMDENMFDENADCTCGLTDLLVLS